MSKLYKNKTSQRQTVKGPFCFSIADSMQATQHQSSEEVLFNVFWSTGQEFS